MDWLKLLAHLQSHARITPIDVSVGVALATFSNDTGEHVWPSQAVIGERCGRSASVVGRSLATLRAHGLLEWEHRFNGPTNDNPLPSATSNLYEFRLPRTSSTRSGCASESAATPSAIPATRPARPEITNVIRRCRWVPPRLSWQRATRRVLWPSSTRLAGRPARLVLLAKDEYDLAWKRHRLRE